MKLLILSSDKSITKWESLPDKLQEIKDTLKVFDVDVKYEAHTTHVSKERISHVWLNSIIKPYFDTGYDIVAFHFSQAQCKQWGIKGIRGANPKTDDEMGDLYFWSDEDSKRLGLSQFVQTCLHEITHKYYAETKQKDITHEYHAPLGKYNDIKPLVRSLDWNLYQPRRMALKKTKNLLESLVSLYTRLLAKKEYIGLKPCVERGAEAIISEMARLGHPVRLVQGFRSIEEQNKLYEQGRTTAGAIVTNAKGGQSLHNYGCAVDFVFKKEGYNASSTLWELLGKVGEKQGFEWGGRWRELVDKPHLQMTLGYSLRDFQEGKVDYNKFK